MFPAYKHYLPVFPRAFNALPAATNLQVKKVHRDILSNMNTHGKPMFMGHYTASNQEPDLPVLRDATPTTDGYAVDPENAALLQGGKPGPGLAWYANACDRHAAGAWPGAWSTAGGHMKCGLGYACLHLPPLMRQCNTHAMQTSCT